MSENLTHPVADKARVTDKIFADLKEEIVSGAIRRGAKLPTERELAARYGVSVPTVREAVRGLSLSGFVQVRHGSGAYVTADDESLVAKSLGSIMRMRDVRARDALDLLNLFIEHAAAAAIAQSTNSELQRVRDTAERCEDRSDVERSAANARAFHHALVAAAHNPLLLTFSAYLVDVQTEFMTEVARRAPDAWRNATAGVQEIRMKFVAALEARNLKQAVAQARAFGVEAVRSLEAIEKTSAGCPELPALNEIMASVVARIERR